MTAVIASVSHITEEIYSIEVTAVIVSAALYYGKLH